MANEWLTWVSWPNLHSQTSSGHFQPLKVVVCLPSGQSDTSDVGYIFRNAFTVLVQIPPSSPSVFLTVGRIAGANAVILLQ